VAALVTFHRPLFEGNFGVVDAGRVYRSAQPGGYFDRVIRERRLASVLNLRGGSMDDPWYAREVGLTRDYGIDFYDFPMSATRRPSRRELLALLDLFTRCRYPLLIHCKSGSDRTGLATALYLMSVRGLGPWAAGRGGFSLGFGHVPLAGTQRLHEPLDEYARWLAGNGQAHSPERFCFWVTNLYEPGSPAGPPPPIQPGPRLPLARRLTSKPTAQR
jgi:hypothetical protein